MTTEVEIKLHGEHARCDGEVVEQLAAFCGIELGETHLIRQKDTYLDDPSASLARAGFGLRLRNTDRKTVLCLKSGGSVVDGVHRRSELETEWRGSAPKCISELDGRIRTSIASYLLGRTLEPSVELQTERHQRTAICGEQRAEVCADTVTVMVGDREVGQFRELEIEVEDGDLRPWHDWAEGLRAALGLRPSVQNKLERARSIGQLPVAGTLELTADLSAAEWARRSMQARFRRFQNRETKLRSSERPRNVHKLRVASRRLRSLAAVFRSVLATESLEQSMAQIKKTARRLEKTRELDVLITSLEVHHADLPEAALDGAERFIDRLRERRERASSRALRKLDAAPRLDGLIRLEQLLSADQSTADGPSILQLAVPLVNQLANEVFARGRRLQADSPTDEVHDLRLAIKQLRYCAAEFQPLFGEPLAQFTARTEHLQELLGRFNDADSALRSLGGWLQEEGLDRSEILAIGGWMMRYEDAVRRSRPQLLDAWAAFDTDDLRTHLQAALAQNS